MRSPAYIFSIILSIIIIGCAKEYSFEGGNANPTIGPGTTPPPAPAASNEFPVCPFCKTLTTTELSTWSFKTGNTIACGKMDTAIVAWERNGFTFFGPSSCSADTGMVITVYLENDFLNRDITNLVVNRVAFYYYDRVTPSYIFMGRNNIPFSLTIESYSHQTGIASGTFSGTVLRSDGRGAIITSGKFKVRLL